MASARLGLRDGFERAGGSQCLRHPPRFSSHSRIVVQTIEIDHHCSDLLRCNNFVLRRSNKDLGSTFISQFGEEPDIYNFAKYFPQGLPAGLSGPALASQRGERNLAPFEKFGSNPGNLKAWVYVPLATVTPMPVVVILHGCTQTAASYDHSAAWSAMAEEHGFIVLFPEQDRANNPNLCFNWFSPRDARRGGGEALSIAQMIAAVHERYGTDASKVFVTGLSAGGAMSAVMLATYPELFAGGGIIAGLPYGTAKNVPQALERMRGQGMPSASELGELVRSASHFSGSWPAISVWHGTSDATVDPVNGQALVDQWRQLHGVDEPPSKTIRVGEHTHRVWINAAGRQVIEHYLVAGMGHGTPLDTRSAGSVEVAGPHMLEAGISSTRRLAHNWGIEGAISKGPGRTAISSHGSKPAVLPFAKPVVQAPGKIASTIEGALRAAGLLR
jgi:poly(hydroxyalkanoate) depolymerase family esterase